ncbi:hypothetical protein [Pseudomonas sp. R45(2017)]|uniref:hypothetical protein n=1 Tax=Pseudomonas sp. R45(2017) TaxID=1981678 RepID=UPI00111C523E|nr:hypothetical protein [Pseudomonas sp. R45(2017)]
MKMSHCICPSFLSKNIGDDSVFYTVFLERLLMSEDQIVLDREERLATSYVESIQEDRGALENYFTWKKMLDRRDSGKTLISSSGNATSFGSIVYSTISSAATAFKKVIIAEDNNHYSTFIQEINRQRIQLYNLQNLTSSKCAVSKKKPDYTELEEDLEWVLHRLGRRAKKDDSEDYNNDYLRDMLSSKDYEIKDQTREGKSMSGSGAGELDLVVEDDGYLFTLIEAMKLTSVDVGYIEKHYLKLLHNYNPLEVKRTFLVSYYSGSNFSSWWDKYKDYVVGLNMSKLVHPDYSTSSKVDEQETPYGSVKKLHHHLNAGGEHCLCTHFAIRIGR